MTIDDKDSMAERNVTDVDEHMLRLNQLGARDRLADRERYRLVVDAYERGMTQRGISGCLGTLSQATITRMLQNAAANPQLVRETPAEVIDRCVAGLISSDDMMKRLHNWDFELPNDRDARDHSTSTDVANDWTGVEQAFRRGQLSDEQFDALTNRRRRAPEQRENPVDRNQSSCTGRSSVPAQRPGEMQSESPRCRTP